MNMPMSMDEQFLTVATAEAQLAASEGNAPIGAVLADNTGTILARNHNRVSTCGGLLYHAEMMLLLENQPLFLTHRWSLTLYTTLEPCLMCLNTALVHHIKRIGWLINDHWAGGTRCLRPHVPYMRQNRCDLIHQPIPALEQQVAPLLMAFYAQKWPVDRVRMMLADQIEQIER